MKLTFSERFTGKFFLPVFMLFLFQSVNAQQAAHRHCRIRQR